MSRNRFKRFLILATCLLPVVLSCNVRDSPPTPRTGEHIGALKIWLTEEEVGSRLEHIDLANLELNMQSSESSSPGLNRQPAAFVYEPGKQTTLVQEQYKNSNDTVAQYIEAKLFPAFGSYNWTGIRVCSCCEGSSNHETTAALLANISEAAWPLLVNLSPILFIILFLTLTLDSRISIYKIIARTYRSLPDRRSTTLLTLAIYFATVGLVITSGLSYGFLTIDREPDWYQVFSPFNFQQLLFVTVLPVVFIVAILDYREIFQFWFSASKHPATLLVLFLALTVFFCFRIPVYADGRHYFESLEQEKAREHSKHATEEIEFVCGVKDPLLAELRKEDDQVFELGTIAKTVRRRFAKFILPYLPSASFAEQFFQPATWQFLFFQPVIIGTLVYVFWEKIKIRQISRLDGNNHTDRY